MGNCSSCESAHVATAKLILQDGRLQEFPYPVKVSYVLSKNPTYFICNADEMEFDDVVSAVSDEDELQLGQIYFALPLSQLKHRLQAEEMAALAVKASSALTKSGCHRKGPSPLGFSDQKIGKSYRSVTVPAVKAGCRSCDRNGGASARGGGGRRKFTAILSAIPE